MTLTSNEHYLLTRIARKSGMDCWFDIRQDKKGNDYIYDLEEHKRICLKHGIAQLIDGISGQYDDYIFDGEPEILYGLFIRLCGEKMI